MNVTPKQLELLQAVHAHREATGINASCPDLSKALGGIARVSVWQRVQGLIVLGLLAKAGQTGAWHSIHLTDQGQAIVNQHRRRPPAWKIAGTLSAKGVRWTAAKELAAQ